MIKDFNKLEDFRIANLASLETPYLIFKTTSDNYCVDKCNFEETDNLINLRNCFTIGTTRLINRVSINKKYFVSIEAYDGK